MEDDVDEADMSIRPETGSIRKSAIARNSYQSKLSLPSIRFAPICSPSLFSARYLQKSKDKRVIRVSAAEISRSSQKKLN